MNTRVMFFVWMLLALFASSAYPVDNPVSYDTSFNDCDVVKYNGEYYITGSWLAGYMYRSRNLEDWGERNYIFTYNNNWYTPEHPEEPGLDIHAGHIRYINGTFHYYTQLGSYITHATSPNPYGPYIEQSISSPFAERIDAETFLDEDGSLHFYSTRFGGVSDNHNDYRPMIDPYTLTGSYSTMIWPTGGWEINPELPEFSPPNYVPAINEGPQIFKYRSQYYMLYNANHTGDTSYAIGCTQASSPTGFDNTGKYGYALLDKTLYNDGSGDKEIRQLGQAWVVDGVNGFEKWCGYFGVTVSEGRTQRIDRMHFFDRYLFIDGPTNRYMTGYHPGPAKPQLLSLFYLPDGPMPAVDWTVLWGSGSWDIASEQARQLAQDSFTFNTVNRDSATNYLIEANVTFTESADNEDKAGVLAYYQDDNNWMIVGLDRFNDSWYYHKKESGIDTVSGAGYSGGIDYTVFHKIRVEKNGSDFHVRIDDQTPPSYSGPISTAFSGTGIPGLYADHAATAYDGIIYTIGWDEYDSGITEWGDGALPMLGTWSIASDGLTQSLETAGSKYIFKGDLMPQYEVATQVYKSGTADGTMGFLPVVVDASNYLGVEVNLVTNEVFTYGAYAGAAITSQYAAVADATSYNLRAVKLSDRIIIFVDGQETLTVNLTFGDASVGLICQNMAARYNGITVYRTEPDQIPAGWTSADVGTVGFAGSADYNEGTFVVNGSGADIWSTADGFQFCYTQLTGDGEIVARVSQLDPTDWWAKAAVMFREDLTSNCEMALMTLAGGIDDPQNAQFIWREGVGLGALAENYEDTNGVAPGWIKVVRKADSFSGWYSEDGTTWRWIGSCNVDMSDTVYVGLAVTSHNNNRLCGATFDNVSVSSTITSGEALPPSWVLSDIGTVTGTGSADFFSIDSVLSLDGTGGDTWGTADGFTFVHYPWTGDVEMTARISFVDWLNLDWTKAGVMIRDDLTASSRFARMALCGNGNLWAMYREPAAASVAYTSAAGAPYGAPMWVRVTRQGDLFTFSKSADGNTWDTVSQQTIYMSSDVKVGLSVNAWDQTFNRNSIFDNILITVPPTLDTTPPAPDPMTFATVPAATGTTTISMTATTATDASGVEYYFTCTAGGGNDSGWQDSTTYEDTGLTPDTSYTYTVMARDKSANQNTTVASSGASATTDSASGPVVVFTDNFESATDWGTEWSAYGSWNRSTAREYDGSYSTEIDGSVTDSALVSRSIDVTGKSSATITFWWYIERGLDSGEYIAFDTDTGSGWVQKADLQGNVDSEDTWASESIVLDVSSTNTLTLRFRGKMSRSNEDAYVDLVEVSAQ